MFLVCIVLIEGENFMSCFFFLFFFCEIVIVKICVVEDGWNGCDLVKVV